VLSAEWKKKFQILDLRLQIYFELTIFNLKSEIARGEGKRKNIFFVISFDF